MPPVNFRLLLVTDRHRTHGRSLPSVLQQAVEAGLPAVQLRERDLPTSELLRLAQQIRAITSQPAVSLIINDRVDLMLALNLDGVHLRANSLPVAVVRRIAGADRLIGLSTHSLAEVRQANRDGADYVVFGPIFDTPSKRQFGSPVGLEQLAEACRLSAIPVFAIGGVTGASAPDVLRAGSHGIAVIGSILDREDAAAATRAMMAALMP
jgi:thiamine-phosphate pyrophosphorylase